jgi:transposase
MNPADFHSELAQTLTKLRTLTGSDPQLQPLVEQISRMQAGYQELLGEREALIAEQKSIIEQLKRMLFGPKSEKLTPEQESELGEVAGDLQEQVNRSATDSEDLLGEETGSEPKEDKPPRRRRGRRPVPVDLEVITTVLEPADAACGQCGKLGDKIGEEVSEQVDLIPAKLVVRRTVRIKRACRCGCGGVAIAPLPAALVPGSRLGLGLAVFILLSKYDDHLALYTLERIFRERHGLILPRQQMVQWIEHIAGLLRLIVDRMWQRMKQGDYLQIDESPVRVLDPEVQGKAAKGYLWFFARPGGDILLVFDRGRSHKVPVEQLQGFAGLFQSDDFSAYQTLLSKMPGLRRAGCAAHVRRRFYEAALEGDRQAIWFIGRFRQLYRLEDEVRDQTPEARQSLRQAQAPAIWAEMKTRAEQLRPLVLPQGSLGKAIRYFLSEYDVLQIYLERPDYQIDNNLCENSIRPSCVGKRRWLFIGHPDAGWRSAVIYSIIQSCRRRGIDPQEYLTDVLGRLPGMKNTQIDCLLPEAWQAARAARTQDETGQPPSAAPDG